MGEMVTGIDAIRLRKQRKNFTCGPASLRIIFFFYGRRVSEQELVEKAGIGKDGTSEYQLRKLSHEYGFSFYGRANGHLREVSRYLERGIPILICYQDWGLPNGNNGHYAVLTSIDKDWVKIADPANHNGTPVARSKRMHKDIFLKRWFEVEVDDNTGEKETIRRWFAVIQPKKRKPRS